MCEVIIPCCSQIKRARTIDDLDAQLTTLYGYDSVEEYKHKDSPIFASKQITIPTLAISSHDDPICAVDGRPVSEEFRGDGLVVATTRYGGHLSFPTNPLYRNEAHPRSEYLSLGSWLQCSWTDGVVLDWFNAFQ
jgi:predicted alpha/beta-fold hydrolase